METSLISAAAQGFVNLLHFKVFLAMLIGVSIGTFTAVAPQGLGMPLVYAIALPIVIKWEPLTGIALLIGASSVSAICAAYLPILFGIPGGSGSQATVLDGYPMGKRGEGRRALGASFMAGGMGSLIGTFTLVLAIPVTRPLIYLMGSPELFVVMLWGSAWWRSWPGAGRSKDSLPQPSGSYSPPLASRRKAVSCALSLISPTYWMVFLSASLRSPCLAFPRRWIWL
jgi:TctA family transporter